MTSDDSQKIVCLADDLTGASVTASLLKAAGLSKVVIVDDSCLACPESNAQAIVVNLDNRDSDEASSIAILNKSIETITELHSASDLRWAIRIDSTLRGHVGATLTAIRSALRPRSLLVAPAFPSAGRLTVGGVQQLPGAVNKSGQFLAKEHDLMRILADADYQPSLYVAASHAHYQVTSTRDSETIPCAGGSGNDAVAISAVVGDARTERDLALLAKELAPYWDSHTVVVDSGPFLAALVRASRDAAASTRVEAGRARTVGASPPLAPPDAVVADRMRGPSEETVELRLPVILIIGSRAPTTKSQVEYLCESAPGVLHLDASEELRASDLRPDELRTRSAIVVSSSNENSPIDEELVKLSEVTERILAILNGTPPLVISGGRTASAIFERLGVHVLEARGELLPLIPLSTITEGPLHGSLVVTKGGLVGNDDTLLCIVKVLAFLREGIGR